MCVCVCVCKQSAGLSGRGGLLLCGGWGPCHLSALAERRPGLESGSSAGMRVLPSEGEERGEESRPTDRDGFINTNTHARTHMCSYRQLLEIDTLSRLRMHQIARHICTLTRGRYFCVSRFSSSLIRALHVLPVI